MNDALYYVLCAALAAAVLIGLAMQSRVKSAVAGNLLCVAAMAAAVAVAFIRVAPDAAGTGELAAAAVVIGASSIAGIAWAGKIKMISMPQTVALLNGVGGLASAVVGVLEMLSVSSSTFAQVTAALAVAIGAVTFFGSMIAAAKLAKIINGKPVIFKGQRLAIALCIVILAAGLVLSALNVNRVLAFAAVALSSSAFGVLFAIRVGGADMPITISLLNSLSGVASGVAGMAIYNVLLVSIGGIVGASGLLLTQIMCRAMNRSLGDILLGKTVARAQPTENKPAEAPQKKERVDANITAKGAKDVIIIPGYGMALSQAQHAVKKLADRIAADGGSVRYAIHPVAGRMPGHMNVLLCEADVDYEQLWELDAINGDFEKADLVIIIGANDVVNPAARLAEGTPIYGMPILDADKAENIIICNFDTKPGYAGVENPLYTRENGVRLMLGDAAQSIERLLSEF